MRCLFSFLTLLATCGLILAGDANRLSYLDSNEVWYPHKDFPKLITPQWVGDEGVECVITLAIDDMRDPAMYEAYLRPILQRLKQIDGRAPVSIMTNSVKPDDPQLQSWLHEGLSIECHTLDHPCPILAGGSGRVAGAGAALGEAPDSRDDQTGASRSAPAPATRSTKEKKPLTLTLSPQSRGEGTGEQPPNNAQRSPGLLKAKATYDQCVDLMASIPNNQPVAFRTPCCDSLNTVSPRLFSEIINQTTAKGNFLQLDSSVYNLYTADDPTIPRELVTDPDGKEKFRKYIPRGFNYGGVVHNQFVNVIENYPYPYVIQRTCWEFPGAVPSDWSAQHRHQPNNPDTVRDWKAALDITVMKQGVFNLVFHPHNWIKPEQVIELIDHAVAKHGKKVKFLTFKECVERLNKNVLDGATLRELPPAKYDIAKSPDVSELDESLRGRALRFADINEDGHADVVYSDSKSVQVRLLDPKSGRWSIELLNVRRGEKPDSLELPPIVREDGSDNGFFVRDRHLCWINEDTDGLPDFILRVAFDKLLGDRLPDAKSPEAAQQSMRVAPGYRVDLVAHEPLTMDPVALDFGPDGKLWVAEMADYPRGIPDDEPDPTLSPSPRRGGPGRGDDAGTGNDSKTAPLPNPPRRGEGTKSEKSKRAGLVVRRAGRVRFLEDTDGDGVYDKSTLFLDDVPFPNGVIAWKKGVLVSAAPDIFYAEDTDGDGKADLRKVLFTGFAEGNQQHRANGFSRGLDNWLYLANGDSGGTVTCVQSLDEALSSSPRPALSSKGSTQAGRGAGGEGIRGGKDGESNKVKTEEKTPHPNPLPAKPGRGDKTATTNPSGSQPSTLDSRPRIDIRGRDIRIRPDTGEIEAISGQTQFGRNRDDWGNWFGNNNSRPMYHYVLDDHYLRRNPHLIAPTGQKDVSVAPGAAPVFPASKTLTRFNDFHTANRFTSACSSMVDRGGMLSRELRGESREPEKQDAASGLALDSRPWSLDCTFISEPVHNLVHREVLRSDGLSFTSERHVHDEQSEFLSSTDNWFRPTQLRTGPDGALYVADMYRLVIEHPEWIPIAWQRKLDLRAGHDKGRIWRLAPVLSPLAPPVSNEHRRGEGLGVRGEPREEEAAKKKPLTLTLSPQGRGEGTGNEASPKAAPAPATRWRLDKLTTAELVAALNSSNGWQRDLAQQLLIDRADPAAVPLLQRMVDGRRSKVEGQQQDNASASSSDPQPSTFNHQPLARLHALCTLDGLKDGLTVPVIVAALNDPHPGVRRHAIRLCENNSLSKEGLVEHLVKRVEDADPQVRMQLAYTLGEMRSTRADAALGTLAAKVSGQPWMMAAVLSSLRADNLATVMTEAIAAAPDDSRLLLQLLSQATAFKNDEAVIALLNRVTEPAPEGAYARWQFLALEQFSLALERRSDKFNPFAKVPEGLQLIQRVEAMSVAIRKLATNTEANLSDREVAVRLLILGSDSELLLSLLTPQQPPSLQSAAITALGRGKRPETAKELLAAYRSLAPTLRAEAATVLLSRDAWRDELLAALEAKSLAPTDLDAASRQRLLDHKTKEVRERAAKLLAVDLNTDRAKLVAEYLPTVRTAGDVQHGRQLFAKRCAQCHKLGNDGHVVGPDLASLTDKSHEALLTAILDPNRAVESKFLTFTAVTKSGITHVGLIANESATSLTLRAAEAKETALLRNELDELQSTTKSLMPEGLEKEVSPTDAAALIAFIRHNVPLPARKPFPGNEPSVVRASADGSFTLTPFTAEIYGPTIVIEESHKNLGWWSSAEDHVVWTLNVPRAGRYAVGWTWACEASSAGNDGVFAAAGKSIQYEVKATSGWDNYLTADLGELELPAGEVRFTLKPASRPLPALADVKSVTLTPKP